MGQRETSDAWIEAQVDEIALHPDIMIPNRYKGGGQYRSRKKARRTSVQLCCYTECKCPCLDALPRTLGRFHRNGVKRPRNQWFIRSRPVKKAITRDRDPCRGACPDPCREIALLEPCGTRCSDVGAATVPRYTFKRSSAEARRVCQKAAACDTDILKLKRYYRLYVYDNDVANNCCRADACRP